MGDVVDEGEEEDLFDDDYNVSFLTDILSLQ